MAVAKPLLLPRDARVDYRPAEHFEHQSLQDLLDLWNERRGDKEFPPYGAITPRDMKAYLRNIHVYDVIDGGADFRIRLVGTALNTRIPDPTGLLLSQRPNPAAARRLTDTAREVLKRRAPVRATIDQPIVDEQRSRFLVEALWLPMGDDRRIENILAQSIVTIAGF